MYRETVFQNNMKNKLYLFLILVLLFSSCGENGIFSDKISEGVVEYEITYLEDEKDNPLISLLPTSMSFKFKDNNSVQKIEGWIGIFSMAGIHNVKDGTNSALLKIMNEKYCYQSGFDGEPFGFDRMPDMKIELVDETKEIAGFQCKKAQISFENPKIEGFEVYYFEKVDLKDPNPNNPFKKIPGVVMEYRMSFQKIPMALKAVKVEEVPVSDEEFDIPDGYEMVSRDKIQEVISNLM